MYRTQHKPKNSERLFWVFCCVLARCDVQTCIYSSMYFFLPNDFQDDALFLKFQVKCLDTGKTFKVSDVEKFQEKIPVNTFSNTALWVLLQTWLNVLLPNVCHHLHTSKNQDLVATIVDTRTADYTVTDQ